MDTSKKLGIFPWYSLESSAPEKTLQFFKSLLNLSSSEFEIPGMGKTSVLQKGDMQFADVSPLQTGKQSHWATYLTVENVDTFLDKAKKMGAKAVGPAMDIPTIGRAALITDPCGANFLAFTPTDWSRTSSALGNEEGMICWNELMVTEPQKATAFYGECMGWKFEKSGPEMGDIEYYGITTADGQKVGGIMKTPPKAKDMPPMWLPYMLTKDIAATSKKAETLGGKVLMQPTEIPKTGVFSLIQDPAGCLTYLFSMAK